MCQSKCSMPHSVPVETPTETKDSTAEPARKCTHRTPQQITVDKEKQLVKKAAKSAVKEAEHLAKEDAKKAEAMIQLQAKEELRRAKEAEKREKMELREAEKAQKEEEKRHKAAGHLECAPFIPVVPPSFKSCDTAGMVSHSQFLDVGAVELNSNTDTASEDDNSVVMEGELAEQEAAISSPIKAPSNCPLHATVIKISKMSLPLEDVSIDLTITPCLVVHHKCPMHLGSVVISKVGDKAGGRSASSKALTAASFNSSKISIKTEPVSDAASFKMPVTDKAVDILDEDSDIVELKSDVSGATKVKATNKDLPYDMGHSNLWLNIFILAAVHFVSMLVNPWSLEDKELIPFLQATYNCIFHETFGPYKSRPKTYSIHSCIVLITQANTFQVGQKLYEWWNGFVNTVIAVLDSVWCSDPHKYEYAAYQREHWHFIYIDYSNLDRKKWTGAFASPLIAQMLAHHYSFVRLAPFIEIDGYEELSERNYKPIGAIALAATMMEHTLDLWKGNHIGINWMMGKTIIKNPVDKYGVEDKWKLQFSVHNQHEPMGLYMLSAQKLKPDALQKVIGAAVCVVKMGTSTCCAVKGVMGNDSD
ncbi:hypothetical protein NEOLEDRAFT_1149850 [Neolentinus lepideus HHB14362 ss-1]|uniref:Uncharacterized protein n=1 Tax=Neolentinus lepideus HHB14362 ss-1 TaxID=1314782 RepID=A0A165QRV1_9AGAM|nr:hypothetical protein NEOLEDRAFT_1149850 [Neolentinus lepideus HHB14362 ss-1]